MKTLFGITYAQLSNLTTLELNEYLAVFAANEVREAITQLWPLDEPVKIEKFLAVYMRHSSELFNSKFDDALYTDMRSLYETEERFNLACSMTDRMGNIGVLVQGMMSKVLEELNDDR